MPVFERFFGRRDPDSEPTGPVANPEITDPLSLQLLFPERPTWDADTLTRSLRDYHPEMADAIADLQTSPEKDWLLGLVAWGPHVIQLVGIDAPLPPDRVDLCVRPAHYKQEWKEQAARHTSHILLYYAGYEPHPVEQYVALAAVAGVLAGHGATLVLNETARTSLPAEVLRREESSDAMLDRLRGLFLLLYCGFVKYEVEDVPGVWMRTHGAHRLGLPDLAFHADAHHQGQHTFNIFSSVLEYLLNSGATLAPGHTMQVGQNITMKLRSQTAEEEFLSSEGELLIAEMISADEIPHRPR